MLSSQERFEENTSSKLKLSKTYANAKASERTSGVT